MEPGVPFALLGAVQLLAIAAGVGLAAAALLRRSSAGAVLGLGSLVLAGVEVDTALRIGDAGSDPLASIRVAGALLVAVGLVTGGLGPRRVPSSMYGVVVPLAASTGPALAAGVAGLLSAVAAVRARRDAVGVWLALGLTSWAAAAFLASQADSGSGAPFAVLVLRGAGAVMILVAVGLLAQASLLSKVVGAILLGVLTMAVAALGVVGSVVVSSYDEQARTTVQDAASARILSLHALSDEVSKTSGNIGSVCQKVVVSVCDQLLGNQVTTSALPIQFTDDNVHDFLVKVPASGAASLLAHRPMTDPDQVPPTALLGLQSNDLVREVLATKGGSTIVLATPVRLTSSSIAVIGVYGTRSADQSALPAAVYIYGIILDSSYAGAQIDSGGYGLFLMAGDPLQVVATNKSDRDSRLVVSIARDHRVASGIPSKGITVGSEGNNPTLAFQTLTSEDGQVVGYVAVTRDAAQALKAERDALRLLLITSLVALLVVAGGATVLGRRTVEPVRQLTEAAKRIAGGEQSVVTGIATRDEVGTLARSFDDMTASLGRLTGDLRDSAARLGTVLASMSDGLLATDGDGIVTSVNRAALAMLGLEEADALGEELVLVADVRDANGVALGNPALVLRDEAAEVFRTDGTKVPVRVAIGPLQGVPGVVMVLRDTTREREVERMKTEFLSNVSHELRTPLTPIRGYAEILVSKPGLDTDKVTTFATTIRDEALKMNRVVDLLVDVAALEAGRVSVFPRPVSVRDLLDGRLDVWKVKAPGRAKDLKRRIATGLPALYVDPSWVGKAFDELIDNAVKYTKPGTAITLVAAWSPDQTRVRVSVKDAGPGIDEADQAGLFTSFEQVDGSATRRVGGLGLGLSFVRRLAEDADFPLTVSSTLGKGAEFSLDLPTTDEPVARAPKKPTRPLRRS